MFDNIFMFILQSLISGFRVTELQQLMTFAQRSKKGRKTELVARALSLVDDDRLPSISFKIQQLARLTFTVKSEFAHTANSAFGFCLTSLLFQISITPPQSGSLQVRPGPFKICPRRSSNV